MDMKRRGRSDGNDSDGEDEERSVKVTEEGIGE